MLRYGDIWALLIIVKPDSGRPKSTNCGSWHNACKTRKRHKTHIRLIF